MPVGGRINRRDNLRSKKALTKSNVPEKIKKQPNETNTALDIIIGSKNKHEIVKGSDNKSEVIAKGFQNFYIRLEDLKLFETKENNNNLGNACLSVKGETKFVSPIKVSNKSPKKEEPKITTDEVVVENLYDTLKIKGRHNKIKEIKHKMAVIGESDTLKRRGRKKKEEIEIEAPIVETVVEPKIEATPKKRGRIPKKKDDLEIAETCEQEVIKYSEINNEKDENNTTSKLSRRNAFQKVREEKIDTKIIVDKLDIIDKLIPGNEEILESQDNNKPRVRASRIAKLVDSKDDFVNKEKENSVTTEPLARTGSRILKNKKPFVIEKTDGNEATEMKIPGLVMLDNIRNRKSEMKLAKENLSSKIQGTEEKPPLEKTDESTNKPTAIDISDLKTQTKSEINIKPKENPPIEKSTVVTIKKKSKAVPKVKETSETNEEIEKSNEIIPGLRMTADIKRRKSEMLVLANENVEMEKKPTNVRQSIRSNNNNSKVPGLANVDSKTVVESSSRLRNTSTIAVREINKPEPIIAAANNNESTVKKTGIDSVSSSQQKPKEKITQKGGKAGGKVPMTSDKIPGLSATSQLKKQKLESLAAQKSATLDRNFKAEKPETRTESGYSSRLIEKEPMKKIDNYLPGTPKAATLDSSASIKFLSFKDQQKPTTGILARPSPFKRPISCLDDRNNNNISDDDLLLDSKCKQSRIQTENRRQSVTFNREVEVKEIHGDSFNSNTSNATDEGDCVGGGSGSGSGDEIMDRLRHELERTKNRVLEKRISHNSSYSHHHSLSNDKPQQQQQQLRKNAIGPSMFATNDSVGLFPKKQSTSDLSNLISTRIKIQSNSPPRENNQEILVNRSRPNYQHQQHHNLPTNIADQSKSGALKKITPFTQKETLSSWKSFQQNPPVQFNKKLADNQINETINDDSMEIDDKKPEEANKSSCLIM